ncbi:MAG: cysteine--tRNA ligase [Mameliella sp.]|mgnify:CR=1 FL=1|nr:cysteine--tRNA ligase [Mameliella sp.]|tara:strand:+ start:21683 stop:23128 length:1446 start_codon:yes stop_codon:yes gene_type:complete
MNIRFTNSATRKKDIFVPIDPTNVRMYLCGPTVYDRAHLGNARPVLVFDVLYRLLRHVYGADHVTYVRNFTDVDDKINATALKRKEAGAAGSLEDLVRERSDETIGWYHADMDALGALRPDHEPRATGYIGEMVAMIETLIGRGHAYAAEGHVLFSVESYAGYGALSGRSIEDMIAGARVEVAPYKKNPMDFVLWKPSTDELPGWDSPWGRGRPGWHIECSAMADKLLWEDFKGKLSEEGRKHPHSFDIHGGGNDLTFPHHENEIAQSKCAHPEGGFANVWLHNEMLQVEGKKMSKSLGNFFTVRDLLEQGVPGEVIRFVMLSTHYRKPMDWTEKKRVEAEKMLGKWHRLIGNNSPGEVPPRVLSALADDLNTPLAISELQKAASQGDVQGLLAGLNLMGLRTINTEMLNLIREGEKERLDELAATLTGARIDAMETKDFSKVDRLKDALIDAGVEVRMSKAGVELVPGAGFDAAKLESLE